MEDQRQKEIREAIFSGQQALSHLEEARKYLSSAANWGIFDMFAGGMLSTMIKHNKIDSASQSMEQARDHLRLFQKELEDVNMSLNLNLEIGSFLTFADYFFDNILTDSIVQSKIDNARQQVEEAILMVRQLLDRLERQL